MKQYAGISNDCSVAAQDLRQRRIDCFPLDKSVMTVGRAKREEIAMSADVVEALQTRARLAHAIVESKRQA
jgi:hypothetical protein